MSYPINHPEIVNILQKIIELILSVCFKNYIKQFDSRFLTYFLKIKNKITDNVSLCSPSVKAVLKFFPNFSFNLSKITIFDFLLILAIQISFS